MMRCVDLIAAFELEINKLNDNLSKPFTDDTLYWINQAVVKFVKERFAGSAPRNLGYEQTEKRTVDLNNLLVQLQLDDVKPNTDHPSYNKYVYSYPTDPPMMFVLNEDVIITDNSGGHKMDTCVFECTADSFMYRINNSLTDFHYKYHRARPLRVKTKDGFYLLTDKNYKIKTYSLGYIKVPEEITNDDPYKVYEDFEDFTWLEITKIAAQMDVENQADERYKTITNEVATQE